MSLRGSLLNSIVISTKGGNNGNNKDSSGRCF